MTRINSNVESLIARRALSVNNQSLNRALARLSTGLRINSGRDDPAGLIASETLRASLRSIDTAIGNANRADTIAAVAEGGLQEISSLLLDLETLIDQSANEAGLTAAEVSANQLQIDSILQSINRLSEATAFGDKKLLNGDLDFRTSGVSVSNLSKVQINSAKIPSGATRAVNINVVTPSTLAMITASATGAASGGNQTITAATTIQIRGTLGSEILSFAAGTSTAAIATAIRGSSQLTGVSATASNSVAGSNNALVFQSTSFGADAFVSVSVLQNLTAFASIDVTGTTTGALAATTRSDGTNGTVTINGANAVVSGLDVAVRGSSLSMDVTLTSTFGGTAGNTTAFDITGGGAVFSISPTVGLSGQESLGLSEVSTAKLGNNGVGFLAQLGTGLVNDLASKNFTTAQRTVRTAIDQVATLRGRIGGFQKNTLASTINSLQVAFENITAAESAIRDADFAVETSNLTRAQILVSASTTVLQIANAQPQNALALLG